MLHLPDNNPLHQMILDKWYTNWKSYLYKKQSSSIGTYHKRMVLWNTFKTMDKYQLLQYTNFNLYKDYLLFYRLEKPNHLSIIYEPYQDDIEAFIDKNSIYIYTDGSIKDGLGGYIRL